MRRFASTVALALIVVAFTACGDDDPAADEVPPDLLVEYDWIEGSVPPPYHYEYVIEIDLSGASSITMIPDYPGDDVPRWYEEFTPSDTDLFTLWGVLVDEGAFRSSWAKDPEPPVGGSSARTTITSSAGDADIPRFSKSGSDQAAAERIHEAIESIVPATTWDDLLSRRQAYEDDYES